MKFLFLCTSSSGGTWPPVIAIMKALQSEGHKVFLVAEQPLCNKTQPDTYLAVPEWLQFSLFYNDWLSRVINGQADPVASEFLIEWATAIKNTYLDVFQRYAPDCVVTCLSCIDLARQLADTLNIAWCIVNPGCYLGENSIRPIEEDFTRIIAPSIAHYYPHRFAEATVVIHATDSRFDPQPSPLPDNQFCSGPLEWESAITILPSYLDEPGDPWILVSAGTYNSDKHSEFVLEILNAIKDRRYRVLATLEAASTMRGYAKEKNIYFEQHLPHSQVMPKCRYYIGPAGHGTVLKCLRYGLPMVLIPIGFDQPGVAYRAHRLGCALVVPPQDFCLDHLNKSIDELTVSAKYRSAAEEMANYLQNQYLRPGQVAQRAAKILLERLEASVI